MTVEVDQVYGVTVEVDQENLDVDVGDAVQFKVTVQNQGNDDDTFRTAEELEQIFQSRGADPSLEIVSYCRLSHRATLLWFTAKLLLGYPRARSYDGSWTEWGSMVGMPIEKP